MAFPPPQPMIQYCPKCGWISEIPIVSDCLFIESCPKCNANLSMKPISSLPLLTQMKLKLSILQD